MIMQMAVLQEEQETDESDGEEGSEDPADNGLNSELDGLKAEVLRPYRCSSGSR